MLKLRPPGSQKRGGWGAGVTGRICFGQPLTALSHLWFLQTANTPVIHGANASVSTFFPETAMDFSKEPEKSVLPLAQKHEEWAAALPT